MNYADCLDDSCGYADLRQAAETHHIFMTERDRMLCQSLQQLSQNQSQCVVGVVGIAHLPGIIRQWNSDKRGRSPEHAHMSAAPHLQAQGGGGAMQGVRRALLERFIGLSCSSAVHADMQRQLSPLPAEAVHPYALTRELYGSPRMLLAMLPQEHLHKVRQLITLLCMCLFDKLLLHVASVHRNVSMPVKNCFSDVASVCPKVSMSVTGMLGLEL